MRPHKRARSKPSSHQSPVRYTLHCAMLCYQTCRGCVCDVSTDSSRHRESSREVQVDAGFSRVASTCPGSRAASSPAARGWCGSTAAPLAGRWEFGVSCCCLQTPARIIYWLTFPSPRVISLFFQGLGGFWRHQDLIPAQLGLHSGGRC